MVAVSCAPAVSATPTQAMVRNAARMQAESWYTEEQVAMAFASLHLP
jgi:post-segregation antitoxin (ccd killing protein)